MGNIEWRWVSSFDMRSNKTGTSRNRATNFIHSYIQNAHQKHLVSVPNLRQRHLSKIYTGHKIRIIQRQRRPLYCSKPTSSASSSPINSASTSSPTQPSNS